MSHITVANAQAWTEKTKLDLGATLDGELEDQLSLQVLAKVAGTVDTSTWVDQSTTPRIIKSVIAMLYAATWYRRTYSEESDTPTYADILQGMAENLLEGILAGTVDIVEITTDDTISEAQSYPTDTSSALSPTVDDPSLGPNAFSMSTIW
jgi:hypothetical protein